MPKYNDEMDLLFFTNPQKVFRFFLRNPNGEFFDRDVAVKTGMSYSGTNFALRDLARTGLLTRSDRGRMVYYRLNRANSVIGAYLKMNV